MKHRAWIAISGLLWFIIGLILLYKGLQFIAYSAFQENSFCHQLGTSLGSPQQAATLLIALGLLIGFVKGRFVLSKTVKRVTSRIASLPLPIRLKDVYSASYWILISCMILLGLVLRFVPTDIRGVIDVAVGSALINGALLYFKALTYGTDFPVQSR